MPTPQPAPGASGRWIGLYCRTPECSACAEQREESGLVYGNAPVECPEAVQMWEGSTCGAASGCASGDCGPSLECRAQFADYYLVPGTCRSVRPEARASAP